MFESGAGSITTIVGTISALTTFITVGLKIELDVPFYVSAIATVPVVVLGFLLAFGISLYLQVSALLTAAILGCVMLVLGVAYALMYP